MSLAEILAADVETVFLGADCFEETVTYTTAGGSSSSITAVVVDMMDITTRASGGMDSEQVPGASATAQVYVSEATLADPGYGDTVLQGSRTWNVREKSRQAGMWILYCTADERMSL